MCVFGFLLHTDIDFDFEGFDFVFADYAQGCNFGCNKGLKMLEGTWTIFFVNEYNNENDFFSVLDDDGWEVFIKIKCKK